MIRLILAVVALLAAAQAAHANMALAQGKLCLACHAVDKPLVGPAFRDIAARYSAQPQAAQQLTDKVIKGGSGVWGAAAMPPNALTPGEANALVAWVLAGAPAATPGAVAPMATAKTPVSRPVVAESVVRQGRYLVEHVMACGNCHAGRTPDTTPISGMELAGGRVYDNSVFLAQPGNLTSDADTGIGRWSAADLVKTITQGARPNGTPMAPMMPSNFYKALTDEDAQAIAAYLATVPPVASPTRSPQYRQAWNVDRYPDAERRYDAQTMAQDKLLRGRYLAALAHCLDCHTPTVNGATDYERDGGKGGKRFGVARVLAPNISSHPSAGVGSWADAELRRALFEGRGRDGRTLQYPMAWPYLAGLTAYDKDSLVTWVRSLSPRE